MRFLFEIDPKDYNPNGKKCIRPSSRAIIRKDGKLFLIHSVLYDYYKFPGGGIEPNESKIDALIRETKEEAGLVIKEDTIQEYGWVHRIHSYAKHGCDIFEQDNYYYLCEVEEKIIEQNLDQYENDENFTLVLVDPREVIDINLNKPHGPKDQRMIIREAKVMQMLIEEGLI